MTFQFHKGTIKTNDLRSAGLNAKLFQFHKGTIKTDDVYHGSTSTPDFNSIKVRLKL